MRADCAIFGKCIGAFLVVPIIQQLVIARNGISNLIIVIHAYEYISYPERANAHMIHIVHLQFRNYF